MSNKNELTLKSKSNLTLSGKKPLNAGNTRYRFLSMNDSLLSTKINNSMEERKNTKEINLCNSKCMNTQSNLNNTVNSDSKQSKTFCLPSEAKTTLKNVYSIFSRNSAVKRPNIPQNAVDIPIPKNKIQSKIKSCEKNYNVNANNNANYNNLLLKAKVNSSILFNVQKNNFKDANANTNTNNHSLNSGKDKLLEFCDDTSGAVNKNSNPVANNNSSSKSDASNSRKNSKSKDKKKFESKTRMIVINNNNTNNNTNNIPEHKAVNFTHGSIPNNTIINPSFKKTGSSDIPNSHLNKNSNNHNSNNINNYYNNSPKENSKKSFTLNSTSSYKLNMKVIDEMSSYKLQNTKLENEILLLNEKIKSLNQTQIFFSNENDILKSKLTDLQEDYKRDLENMKKYKSELNQLKIINKKFSQNTKSAVNTMLDIIELFLSPRSNNPKQSLLYNDNNSYSIDIYDSYNNEEERRNVVFDQIQNLLISKLSIMKRILNVNFDQEIDKVRNWSHAFNVNKSNNNDINVSNIKLSVKNYESSSYESSKKNSQDFFDLSISNQFFIKNNSPKFNNSFGIENENANACSNATSEKLIKMTAGNKSSNSNIIGTNAFNTNNFLSAGNISLNNFNRINSNSNANNISVNSINNILGMNSENNSNNVNNAAQHYSECSSSSNNNNAVVGREREKDCNPSFNNNNNLIVNTFSSSNMNSHSNSNRNGNNNFNYINNNNNDNNLLNNNACKDNNNNNNNIISDEKMIPTNLNFNDSFLKDLNSGQCKLLFLSLFSYYFIYK